MWEQLKIPGHGLRWVFVPLSFPYFQLHFDSPAQFLVALHEHHKQLDAGRKG